MSPGGVGGSSFIISSSANAGPGSLREIAEAAGRRVVTLDTTEDIITVASAQYRSRIVVGNPHLTINGNGKALNGTLVVQTHNVVIRNMVFKLDASHFDPAQGDCIQLVKGAHHVIFDHCEFHFGIDEVAMLWGDEGEVHDVTFQDCIFGYGLNNSVHPEGAHSTGILLDRGWRNISYLRCVVAFCRDRLPKAVNGGALQFVNNVIYLKDVAQVTQMGGILIANVTNNLWVAPSGWNESHVKMQPVTEENAALSQIYMAGNKARVGFTPDVEVQVRGTEIGVNQFLHYNYLSDPNVMPVLANEMTAAQVYDYVLANAGCTPRTAIGETLVQHIDARTGSVIDNPSEVL